MSEKIRRPISLEHAQKVLGLANVGEQMYTLPGVLIKVLGSELAITLYDSTETGIPETTFVTESPFTHEANGKLYLIRADGTKLQVEEEATLVGPISE